MKKSTISVFLWSVLFVSCGKENNNPAADEPAPKAYTISGLVKDIAGNPIKNARIRVENPNGNNIHYTSTSNDAGKYNITVSAIGGYKIYAWKETAFENQTYQIRLGMENDADYDAFSVPANGVIKDFVWKLNGRIPDRVVSKENGAGYFGGTIKFINYSSTTDQMPSGTEITIALTPVANAKFLDGRDAAGKTVEKKFTIADGVGQAYYINDIAAAQYMITASAVVNGINKIVRIGRGTPDVFYLEAVHYFKPEGGSGSYESGLGSPNEYAFYLTF